MIPKLAFKIYHNFRSIRVDLWILVEAKGKVIPQIQDKEIYLDYSRPSDSLGRVGGKA